MNLNMDLHFENVTAALKYDGPSGCVFWAHLDTNIFTLVYAARVELMVW